MTCIITGFKKAFGVAYGNTQSVYTPSGTVTVSNPSGANGTNLSFSLPTMINNVPTAVYLGQQVSAGYSDGMMMQWTGTGSCCVPSRTTPIKPYTFLPLSYTHSPNTGLDTSSQLTAGQVTSLVLSGTYNDESFNNSSPNSLALGWWGYQPIGAGAAALGATDASLTELISTQTSEWANFSTIQGNTRTALLAATPSVVNTLGVTPYASSALAQAQIDLLIAADIASHTGAVAVGNTVSWIESVGTILSGTGTVSGPTFVGGTDPRSLHATCSMSKTFLGGYDIKRTSVKAYSIRADAGTAFFSTGYGSTQTPPPGDIAGWPDTVQVTGYGATFSPAAIADMIIKILAVCPPTSGDGLWNSPFIGAPPNDNRIYYWDVGHTVVAHAYTAAISSFGASPSNFIDYQVTTTLSLVANGSLTATSTMTATQESLMWNIPL